MKRNRNAVQTVNLGWMGAMTRAIRWCLFIGILGFIVAQYFPLIHKNQNLRESLGRWREKESKLATEHDGHLRRLHSLRNDPSAVERAARERLQLARPDESIVSFIVSEGAAASKP
jgi:cell division protein FtsB